MKLTKVQDTKYLMLLLKLLALTWAKEVYTSSTFEEKRRKYSQCITETWDALLKALFDCTQSPHAAYRESAFRIFATIPDLIANQHADALQQVFLSSLTDVDNQSVRKEEGRLVNMC